MRISLKGLTDRNKGMSYEYRKRIQGLLAGQESGIMPFVPDAIHI